MWIVTQHKAARNQQEIKVSILIKSLAEYSYATFDSEFKEHFNDRIKEIPRTNNYEASYFFKVKSTGLKSLDIWKTTINGDLKFKMFTLQFLQKNH